MLSVTIPNITPPQNTPVLPNMRRMVTRPSGASCSRRNSAKLSLATILRPPSGKVRHDIRGEKLTALDVVPRHLLAGAGDHHRRTRLLHRLRLEDRVLHIEKPALEGPPRVALH